MATKINGKKSPRAITIALVKDPEGTRWQAQVQIEYKFKGSMDALEFVEDTPMACLHRASKAIDRRCYGGGSVFIS